MHLALAAMLCKFASTMPFYKPLFIINYVTLIMAQDAPKRPITHISCFMFMLKRGILFLVLPHLKQALCGRHVLLSRLDDDGV